MSRTKIPGIAYLFIGVFVGTLSYYIDSQKSNPQLKFFMFIGLVFIAYGVFKTILERFILKNTPKAIKNNNEHKYCDYCGSKLRKTFNYCYNCGKRVN